MSLDLSETDYNANRVQQVGPQQRIKMNKGGRVEESQQQLIPWPRHNSADKTWPTWRHDVTEAECT